MKCKFCVPKVDAIWASGSQHDSSKCVHQDAFPEYICLVSSPTHPFSIPGVGVVVISHLQALMCFPCDVFGQYSWLGVVVGHGS